MKLIYSRPILEDLSQGSRIRFIRIFRHLSQDNVSDDLGITGENKRRTMNRYEMISGHRRKIALEILGKKE